MRINRPIISAVTIFAILLLVYFFVMPEYNKFKSLQQELGEKKAEFNAEFDYYNEIAKTYSALQSRKDGLAKIDDALPTQTILGRLIYFLQQKAGEKGIMISNFFLASASGNRPAVNSGQNVRDLSFSLNVLGTYNSLEDFIQALENSSRLFEISSISFSAPNSGGSGSLASADGQTASAALPAFLQPQQVYSFNLEIKTHSY